MTTDPRFRTADGVEITDGLRVWDNDLRSGVVDFAACPINHAYWDGWFAIKHDEGGYSMVNGERMTTRHPFTREAPPALAGTRDMLTLADRFHEAMLAANMADPYDHAAYESQQELLRAALRIAVDGNAHKLKVIMDRVFDNGDRPSDNYDRICQDGWYR